MKTNAAIYTITFGNSKRIYIGSTLNYQVRRSQHLYCLRNKTHTNKKLQNYYNKYGEDKFTFKVVECFLDKDVKYIRSREQEYLDYYYAKEFVSTNRQDKRFDKLTLNCSPEVGLEMHYWSEDRKQRQIESNKARIWTQESIDKMNLHKIGSKLSEDHKEAIRKSMKETRFDIKLLEDRKCIHCGTNDVNKCGIRSGKQRCYCNKCKKRFTVSL